MDPMTIMAILSGLQTAGGVAQQIAAGAKRRKAQAFFDQNKFEIPAGVKAMLSTVQGMASQRGLPGEDIYRQQLASTTAQGVESAERSAKSPSDVLGVLAKLYGKQMDSQNQLAIAGANQYQQNQQRLAQAFGTLGGYETQKWNYNVLYPYMQRMQAAGQLAGAGTANIASGVNSGMNLAYANWQMQQDQKNMNSYINNKFGNNYLTPASEPAIKVEDWMLNSFGNTASPNGFTEGEPNPNWANSSSFTPYR